jgi:ABC-type transport system substrate-binding protein
MLTLKTALKLPLLRMIAVGGFFCLFGCGGDLLQSEFEAEESVVYGNTSRIRGLDPATSGEVSSSVASAQIYEGLLQYSYLERPYKLEPLLAEAMPAISEDGLTYTFKVRSSIFFQDDPCFPDGIGRELTAHDFVYAIKRIADQKLKSSGYWAFNGRVVGLDEFRDISGSKEPTDYSREVAGLRALDQNTLQITLTGPYPQLLYILAMHYAFAVPQEAVAFYGDDFVNHPVGTGPYILHSWKRNSRIEFVRNPKWEETGRVELYPSTGTEEQRAAGFLADAGKQLPFIDRIVQFVVDDSTTAWMMFLSGQFSFSSIPRDNWDAVITGNKKLNDAMGERGVELITSPTLDCFYMGFNWDDPVVGRSADLVQNAKNRKLRQALSCAFNFDKTAQFYNNRIYPLHGPVSEPLAGSLKEPSPYQFNLEKARALLVEAGYPEGKDPATDRRLELTIELGSADSNTRQSVALMIDMFDEIGVILKPSYNTWPAFIEKMNRRQAQIFQLGWVADYPDAENFLQLFYSKNESPGPNHANYRNAEFDVLYEKVRFMQDSPERTKLYEQMAGMVVEDCPWIFLYQPMSFALKHCWLENYVPHDFPYGMTKYRRLNPTVRAEWRAKYSKQRMDISGGK